MKIEIELTGFTPVLDNMIEEYDLVTAAIYGIVWRYAQMDDKVCKASLEKIGKRLDMSGKTAERHIKKLCDGGYLADLSPNLRNKPHIYAITGKAELDGSITARSDRESYLGQTESLTRSDRESDLGQTESPLKIHSKKDKEDINGSAKNLSSSEKKELNILADVIGRQCNISTKMDEETRERLKATALLGYEIAGICKLVISIIDHADPQAMENLVRVTIALYRNDVACEMLKNFSVWWYDNTWQGIKGQDPTPLQIASYWGQFEAARVVKVPVQSNGDSGFYL